MREMVAEVGGKKIWADEALHRVVGKTMTARPRQILRNVNTWQVVLARSCEGFACSSSHLKAMVVMKSSDRWTRTGLTEKLKSFLADGDINGVI